MFEWPGIGAMVLLAGNKNTDEFLGIGEHGIIGIPDGVKTQGFHLVLMMPREARIVIAQKNVDQDKGGYHSHALAQLSDSPEEFTTWVMHDPIRVSRFGPNVWTDWKSAKPNRVDCWLVSNDGHLGLFQVGIVTHDDGKTFRLIGEYRWRGKIFKNGAELVAKPDDSAWGSLLWNPGESRYGIREHPEFHRLLAGTEFEKWGGSPQELEPPLNPVPEGRARVEWYIPFAGQKGQGIARLPNSSVWVLGQDILNLPDEDGIKRLRRNELLRYTALHYDWGTKTGLPKLLNVRRV